MGALQRQLDKAEQEHDLLNKTLESKETELREQRENLQTSETEKVRLEEQLKGAKTQDEFLSNAKEQLRDAFKSLSGDVLGETRKTLVQDTQRLQESAKEDLKHRQIAVDNLVKPLGMALENMQKSQTELHVRVDELKNVASGLDDKTRNLVTALRRPEVRGRWGELQLKRVVELAGMQQYVDYLEQPSESGGTRRPDMIVHLPNERQIVIDAKTNINAYLDANATEDNNERREHLKRHVDHFKQSLDSLSKKRYWDNFEHRPDFVVMFIPNEAFYSAALQEDHNLIEIGAERSVLIATPTILIALLRAVALGWREKQLAESALQIGELGKVLYDRARVLINHISDIGTGIDRAVTAYNKAVGSLELNYLPQIRRFRDLGATQESEIQSLEPSDIQVRVVSHQKDLPQLKQDGNEIVGD